MLTSQEPEFALQNHLKILGVCPCNSSAGEKETGFLSLTNLVSFSRKTGTISKDRNGISKAVPYSPYIDSQRCLCTCTYTHYICFKSMNSSFKYKSRFFIYRDDFRYIPMHILFISMLVYGIIIVALWLKFYKLIFPIRSIKKDS